MCFGLSHNLSPINLIYHLYIYVPMQFTYVFSKTYLSVCYVSIYVFMYVLSIYLASSHMYLKRQKDYDLTERSETLRFLTFLGSDIQQHGITKTFRFAIR